MNIFEEQRKLEEDMIEFGIEKFRKQVREAKESSSESTSLHGILLMKQSVDKFARKIDSFVGEALQGGAGRKALSAPFLAMLESEVSAFITLRSIMDGISKSQKLTNLAFKIGQALEDQVKFNIYRKEDKHYFDYLVKQVGKRSASRHYRRYGLLKHCKNKIDVEHTDTWTVTERIQVGLKCVDLLVRSTGLVKVVTMTKGRKKKELTVLPTDTTLDWIERINSKGELLSPAYAPMVCTPKDWTSPFSGGYLTKRIGFIKTSNKNIASEIAYHDMKQEYSCVNALQNTQWCVNKKVLDTMKRAWELNWSVGSMPDRTEATIPPCPAPKGMKKKDMDEEMYKKFIDWKTIASECYAENVRRKSKILQFIRTLSMAEKYSKYDGLYFPYQVDFRGRKYTVSSFLTPQGTEYAKALLTFANALPIENQEQANWLAIHGANCAGVDKLTLDERIEWVEENTENIINSAKHELDCGFWKQADDPWLFLAFCYEWAGFKKQGFGYKSSLPVALDGSNNGLQHYSAMLRCKIGGKATNLMHTKEPQDIYQDVADCVLREVRKEMEDGDEMAEKWLNSGLINRKMTKRPVMVVPYGGTRFSCRSYVEEYVREAIYDGANWPWDKNLPLYVPVNWITSRVWNAITEVVVSAREAMDWIRKVSSLVSKQNYPLIWWIPSGMVIHQQYKDISKKKIFTHIDGVLVKPTVQVEDDSGIDNRRSVNGSAPNFVHSLDACALTFTVNMCLNKGVNSFQMIHDSYGTHASKTPELAQLLREAFVKLYKEFDALEEFKQSALEVVDYVPNPPKRGDLNIEEVLKSKYFFC